MNSDISECRLCPRNCGVDRTQGLKGYCGMSGEIRLARAALHMWEEPCISGVNGSGAVFFSGCPLRCVYCQNHSIALGNIGKAVTLDRLVDIFFELKEKGAHNINLVTPTHYVPQIAEALLRARNKGLELPVVYNTSSYENVETLKLLDGLIDIYLPDFKYYSPELAARYSHAPDYPQVATAAIHEMLRQTGKPVFEGDMMRRGVIVRHLVLPGHTKESMAVVSHLLQEYGNDIYIRIMNQYTPMESLEGYPELKRRVTDREYNKVIDFALEAGLENGFIQEGDTAKESFIPDFSYEGV